MVVTLLYTYTGTEIGTKIGIEVWRYGAGDETAILIAYYLEFVACRVTLVVWVVWVVWSLLVRFLTSIKKFFNFPKFFSNYLIFNAFQI